MRYPDDRLRRERNSETLGSATQNGQTGGRRVFRPRRFGKVATQSTTDGKRHNLVVARHCFVIETFIVFFFE